MLHQRAAVQGERRNVLRGPRENLRVCGHRASVKGQTMARTHAHAIRGLVRRCPDANTQDYKRRAQRHAPLSARTRATLPAASFASRLQETRCSWAATAAAGIVRWVWRRMIPSSTGTGVGEPRACGGVLVASHSARAPARTRTHGVNPNTTSHHRPPPRAPNTIRRARVHLAATQRARRGPRRRAQGRGPRIDAAIAERVQARQGVRVHYQLRAHHARRRSCRIHASYGRPAGTRAWSNAQRTGTYAHDAPGAPACGCIPVAGAGSGDRA